MEALAGHSLLGPILPAQRSGGTTAGMNPHLPTHLAHSRGRSTELWSGTSLFHTGQGRPCSSRREGTRLTCPHSASCLPAQVEEGVGVPGAEPPPRGLCPRKAQLRAPGGGLRGASPAKETPGAGCWGNTNEMTAPDAPSGGPPKLQARGRTHQPGCAFLPRPQAQPGPARWPCDGDLSPTPRPQPSGDMLCRHNCPLPEVQVMESGPQGRARRLQMSPTEVKFLRGP